MAVPGNINLSVIIPTKNRAHLLQRALRSVIEQNYAGFEVCVIDNNTDAEASRLVDGVVQEFRNKRHDIKWIHLHSPKEFASGARNDGMAATNGKYIAFLDDDDELLTDSLKIRVEEMEKDAELALLYCAGYSRIYPYPFKMYRYYRYSKQLHKDRLMMMSCSSIMINRDIFDQHQLRFDERQSRLDDYDLCRRVIELDLKVKSIPDALVQLNIHFETRISSHHFESYKFSDILIERWGPSAAEYVYDYVESVHLWRKCFGLQNHSYREIRKTLLKNFNRKPGLPYRIKFMLVSISPVCFLAIYHLTVSLAQRYRNNKARQLEQPR